MKNKINENEGNNNILNENSNNFDERNNKCKEFERKNKNDLTILKIEEKNFLEKKLIIDESDLLKIKKIVFKNINDLFSENLLIFKKRKYEIIDNSNESEKKQIEELEKECNSLNLEEIIFKNCKINEVNFSNLFPTIKKFKLINCKIPFEIYNNINFNYLTHLSLENVGLVDVNFEHFFFKIRSNISLRKNLKYFSLKNNLLGMIDLCKGIPNNKIIDRAEFSNLEIFDCSNNKIFYVSNITINAIKNIKLFDLTNNNIAFPSGYNKLIKSSNKLGFLLLLTKNYGLLREYNRLEYVNYLFNIISKFNYDIEKLSLINLYINNTYEMMKQIDLSKFNKSLIELDLSYGHINNNDLISLLKNNLALYNLKKLNLTRNKLTEGIFDLLLENKYQDKFTKLKIINLSENQINFIESQKYQNFFENFKSIKLFIVKYTNFEKCINNYLKNKVIRYYENERNKEKKTNYTDEDLEIKKIIDNNNYLRAKTNITININDIYNNKYLPKIKKHFPEILEKIIIETRFLN